MADNKREAKVIRARCLNKHTETYENSGWAWHAKGNVNKANVKAQYSPPRNRQNSHYPNGRHDKLACQNLSATQIEEEKDLGRARN